MNATSWVWLGALLMVSIGATACWTRELPAADLRRAIPDECAGHDNVLFLDGSVGDPSGPSRATITSNDWSPGVSYDGANRLVSVELNPTASDDARWTVSFSTENLTTPLAPGDYDHAQRWHAEQPRHAGMEIDNDARTCATVDGSFTIFELTQDGFVDLVA